MLRVGLTGGIGAGKSTVSARLAELGAVVIDADHLAREVVAPGTPGLDAVIAEFGTAVLAEDGALDRPALATRVFGDDAARGRLNAIIHPRVAARTGELMAAAAPDAIVVHDVPLLVENRLGPGYHLVIVVDAPVDERVRRLAVSRGMSESQARARINAQVADADRLAAADVWLDNTGTPDDLLPVIDTLWAERLVPYEANLRLRRKAASAGGPRLVAYDPTWPVQAGRLTARIRAALGERAVRVDHIGSTAVPGLAGKDRIDLQVAVASLDDADTIGGQLADAGFPGVPGVVRDTPKPDEPDPERWHKLLHGSADPGRAVNVHVRTVGSAGWRFALLFRDWLRDQPSATGEYLNLKRELAAKHAGDANTHAYAEAKEPWFNRAFARANEWAEKTGWTPGS